MPATLTLDSSERPSAPVGLRFGRLGGPGEEPGSAEWLLKRNCSISPAQSFAGFCGLCVVSLGIGTMFWWQGAPFVMPFAGLELLVVAGLLLLYARHATDRETIRLTDAGLVVERLSGHDVVRVEFAIGAVRVVTGRAAGDLIELSGQGRQVQIGRHVRPELRRRLAEELRWALRRDRRVGSTEPTQHEPNIQR